MNNTTINTEKSVDAARYRDALRRSSADEFHSSGAHGTRDRHGKRSHAIRDSVLVGW